MRIPGRPSYLGKTAHYNDIATWAYADLPPEHHGLVVRRQDRRRLHKALGAPNESLILIESIMDPYDAPAAVINCSKRGAEIGYGPRGRNNATTPSSANVTTTARNSHSRRGSR